jgi:hypothetical protein
MTHKSGGRLRKLIAWRMVCAFLAMAAVACAADTPLIFPIPQEMEVLTGAFRLDEHTPILLPEKPSQQDLRLARFLTAELSDWYGFGIRLEHVSSLPAGRRFILMGSTANPLVKQYCANHQIENKIPEGYVLRVDERQVVVAGADDRGAFYGLQSLRQLIRRERGEVRIAGVRVRDWPYKPFRGVKLFLPGRENLAFFRRFLRDFVALYKFNTVILEMNAAMRFDRHPELNAGWIEFAKTLNYSRRDRPRGPGMQYQDSAHHDTGEGGVLEKNEVAEIVRFAAENQIEVIPEVPSLTHSYYLLTRHRELAEISNAEWPDTYCPSNPKSYELLFDVLDEYIDVMHPRMIHVGHDEWRMPTGVCQRCAGKDPRELFAQDLRKIYDHLQEKGVRVAIWGDHLMEDLRGRRIRKVVSPSGFIYYAPGGLSPDQVNKWIPKDILMFNWFWRDGQPGQGESADLKLEQWGFRQVYGNFKPSLLNYGRRSARPGVIGGAPSSWAATTEFNIGKDQLYDFAGCANLLWSRQWPEQNQLTEIVQALMPRIRRNLGGRSLPSADGDPVLPVDISSHFNLRAADTKTGLVSKLSLSVKDGILVSGGDGLPHEVTGLKIGEDVSSLIFLHACAKPAGNAKVDSYVYNAADTADLLGWYEVVYEDGFVETVPLRYGVNILDWNWRQDPGPGRYVYRADPVDCGVTCFAFEWVNPRFGKVIREVHLKASTGFIDAKGRTIPDNPILLTAISKVLKRTAPAVKD